LLSANDRNEQNLARFQMTLEFRLLSQISLELIKISHRIV